jgi:DNA-binding transcriptional ArsR family regulator
MSIRLMTQVWELDLPLADKMVLLVIADHASDDGTNSYPSVGTIARKSSMSARNVQRCLSRLEGQGLVSIQRQQGGPSYYDPSRRPNAYTINGATLSHLIVERGDIQSPRGVTGATVPPDLQSPKPSIEPSVEPSISNVPNKYSEIWGTGEDLANYLADKIEGNGSKRPTVSHDWILTMCRLIDIDQRTSDQVRGAIDWCQADDFWSSNILSPMALRKQYERLRLQATQKQRKKTGVSAVMDYLSEVRK